MPILYDQYQLANSTQIPRFVGSAVPELMKVADTFQDRYDYGVQQADSLDYALKNAAASKFDEPEFAKLKQDYKSRLEQYAKSGDYENMWRKVAMDARDFAGKYKSFADNQAAISKYMTEEGERMSKGEISKADYEANIRRIQDNYQGLQFNPETGQYENKFSANPLVKAPDMIEKINKILTNTHPTVRGYDFKGMSADNMFEYSNGSETKKLSWAEVESYVKSGLAIDPEVQSYIAQQRELAPYMYGFSNRIKEDKAKEYIINTNMAPALEYMKQGLSAKESLFRGLQDQHLSQLDAGIYGLARKGVVDEKTSKSSKTLSGFGSAKLAKEAEDATLSLTAQIWQPDTNTAYTPESLNDTLNQLTSASKNSEQKMATWASSVGLKKVGDRYQDKEGNDVTEQYQKYVDIAAQAARVKNNLEEFKAKAQRESNYTLTPEVKAKAEKARTAALSGSRALKIMETYVGEDARLKLEDLGNEAYENALSEDAGYKRYKEKLNEYSQQSQLIGIQTFNKASQNKAAEDIFKNFALNLDKSGPEFGSFGLQWGTGANAGKPLSADDYKLVRDNAHFAGVGIDADGRYKFFYKVGDINNKNGGKELVVKMPALSGTSQMLIANGQITEAQQYLAQAISNLPATGKVDVDKNMIIDKMPVGENISIGIDRQPEGGYILSFPLNDGTVQKVPVDSRGEAVNRIVNALKKKEAEKAKQK